MKKPLQACKGGGSLTLPARGGNERGQPDLGLAGALLPQFLCPGRDRGVS